MYENKDFDDIFKQININPGDKILVFSSILKLLNQSRKENKKFDGNIIIDSLISIIGENGTLMFPAFNWDFCKGKDFDYNKTPSSAGSLSNLALKRKDFKKMLIDLYD